MSRQTWLIGLRGCRSVSLPIDSRPAISEATHAFAHFGSCSVNSQPDAVCMSPSAFLASTCSQPALSMARSAQGDARCADKTISRRIDSACRRSRPSPVIEPPARPHCCSAEMSPSDISHRSLSFRGRQIPSPDHQLPSTKVNEFQFDRLRDSVSAPGDADAQSLLARQAAKAPTCALATHRRACVDDIGRSHRWCPAAPSPTRAYLAFFSGSPGKPDAHLARPDSTIAWTQRRLQRRARHHSPSPLRQPAARPLGGEICRPAGIARRPRLDRAS